MYAIRKTAHSFRGMLIALGVVLAAPITQAAENIYQQHNLVSDGFVPADNTDANLVNAWGIAFNPFGAAWIANNGSGTSTLYDGAGQPQPLVVQVPPSGISSGKGTPTGIVFNASPGFVVSPESDSEPSRVIFATEDGVIAGWSPNVEPTSAIRIIDNGVSTGAVYKGLALRSSDSGDLLFATDFRNNKIDVFDRSFNAVRLSDGAFSDPTIPGDFAPFGIQVINGQIYVTYAKQDADRRGEVAGEGLGFVNIYNDKGALLRRFATGGTLNAPWGMARAPADFGVFGNCLLVGNFGDGKINAFHPVSGQFLGQLTGSNQQPLQINGLWGIAFGNGFLNQPINTLFFAAGPGDEQHGLYGRIDTWPNTQSDDSQIATRGGAVC